MKSITQIQAMNFNRHDRRALAKQNKLYKIPARQNVKIPWWVFLKFWTWFK